MSDPKHPLTSEDVATIRAMAKGKDWNISHAIVADWRADTGYAVTIIETRRMPEGYEPSQVDRRHTIPCAGRIERWRDGEPQRYVASDSVYRSEAWSNGRVLANVVRAGDELTVRFRIGNDSEGMRAAGMTRDECDLAVIRKGKIVCLLNLETRVAAVGRYGTMADNTYRAEVAAS